MVEQHTHGNNIPELLVAGYDDMLWISLLEWISETKGFVVQTIKKIRHNIASGESMECGITKLVVRNGSQLLTRAID